MEGCDKKCAYCIVPTTRGQEVSRPVEEILDECEWKPLVAPEVTVFEAPSEDELQVLRTQLDVRGQATDAAGSWIIWDGERYVRQTA